MRSVSNGGALKLELQILSNLASRSRERNREHARRTRMRKKAQLATLQMRVAELQTEVSSTQSFV